MGPVATMQDTKPRLTQREWEVLASIAGGRTTREIAAELDLCPATIRTHLRRIFAKLGVSTRSAAVYAGFRVLLRADPWLHLADYARIHHSWPPQPPN